MHKNSNATIDTSTRYVSIINKSKILVFHNLLEQRAELSPDHVGLQYHANTLTYQEYNNKSNQFARYLQNQGVKKGDFIGIYVNRCLELPIIIFGILKCGAVCVSLDIQVPQAQLQLFISNIELRYIIIHLAKFPDFSQQKKILTFDKDLIEQYSSDNLSVNVSPNDLAFVVHTSGSTGRPKGIELEHRGFVNLAFETLNSINNIACCRILQIASIVFDAFIWECCIAVIADGTLVLIDNSEIYPNRLSRTLNLYKIDLIIATTSVLKNIQQANLLYMKTIISGGEACDYDLAINLGEKYTFVNAYGPAEASVMTTLYQAEKNVACKNNNDSFPIGKPISQAKILVLDDNLLSIVKNEIGELYIGGIGLARGYHNNQKLTEEKFIIIDGERFYKTGDLVKILDDNNLVYAGRVDRQIKYRGVRIQLEEIEQNILQNNYVKAIVVHKHADKLIAYIQFKKNKTSNEVEIRKYLRSKLSDRMLPNKYFFIDEIPLNVNGKVDYKALEKISENKIEKKPLDIHKKKNDARTAWSNYELALLKILQDSTDCDDIELDTDFFNLGIDSFTVADFVKKIGDYFCIELPISKVYEFSTIKLICTYIDALKNNKKFNEINYSNEAYIEPEILAHNRYKYDNDSSTIILKNIFLTGATGFIGSFLLESLLIQYESATIYCLIRENNEQNALNKLLNTLKKYKINLPKQCFDRIKFICGDLSLKFFGLNKNQFHDLSSKINIIYHFAADVNFAKSYHAMKSINVIGTKEILRFATYNKIIPIHYASTLVTFGCRYFFEPVPEISEFTDPKLSEPYLKYDIGYTQSKWVAEQIMLQAIERGVPITIYRLGFVLCHSKTGITHIKQFIHTFVMESMRLKVYPKLKNLKQEIVSVDFVCKSVLHLSQLVESTGKIYHLCPSEKQVCTMEEIFTMMEGIWNVKLRELSYEQFLEVLEQDFRTGNKKNNLYPFKFLLYDKVYGELRLLELYQNVPILNGVLTLSKLGEVEIYLDSVYELLKTIKENIK